MITNPGFGVWEESDDNWSTGPRPQAVFYGPSVVEEAVLAGLPSVVEPEPATNRGIYLFGPVISCPARRPVLRCPLDGQRCLFSHPGQRANPKKWAFLLDLVHWRKWVHPGPPCLRGQSSLCNGLVPTCQPFQGGKRDEGMLPFGCKAYKTCWGSWRIVKEFPACIRNLIQ